MTDIEKALEKAAECACGFLYGRGPCDCPDGACGDDRSSAIARAAVLAFLKAMPDAYWSEPNDIGVRHGGIWTTSRLAAAIEKETTP